MPLKLPRILPLSSPSSRSKRSSTPRTLRCVINSRARDAVSPDPRCGPSFAAAVDVRNVPTFRELIRSTCSTGAQIGAALRLSNLAPLDHHAETLITRDESRVIPELTISSDLAEWRLATLEESFIIVKGRQARRSRDEPATSL